MTSEEKNIWYNSLERMHSLESEKNLSEYPDYATCWMAKSSGMSLNSRSLNIFIHKMGITKLTSKCKDTEDNL